MAEAEVEHLLEVPAADEARLEGLPDLDFGFGAGAIGDELLVGLGVELVQRVLVFLLDVLVIFQV